MSAQCANSSKSTWPTKYGGNKRSAAEIERSFNVYVLPEIGNRLADTITRPDVSGRVTIADPRRWDGVADPCLHAATATLRDGPRIIESADMHCNRQARGLVDHADDD